MQKKTPKKLRKEMYGILTDMDVLLKRSALLVDDFRKLDEHERDALLSVSYSLTVAKRVFVLECR